MKLRKNEHSIDPIRWPIFYSKRNDYYFKTREGVDFGPYKTIQTAELGRQLFIYQITGDPKHKPHSGYDFNRIMPIERAEATMPLSRVG